MAEDAAQEAFAAAVDQWTAGGLPNSPTAWLIQTAKHKLTDRLRRQGRFTDKIPFFARSLAVNNSADPDIIPDDQLRLIFTCCHPALARESQIALTLRMLGGLETDEIARAFLVSSTTIAQRIVRAKRKIRDAGIPFSVPDAGDMPQRLETVLTVLYLIFNEGYLATRGHTLIRTDLCREAIRLTRALSELLSPVPSEVAALLAMMLLHDSRRDARFDEQGDIVLLEDQDRERWNRQQIVEALPLVTQALRGEVGPFTLQAAIAAEHCRASKAEDTNWRNIVHLYDLLQQCQPSPVVLLNRAVAIAMAEGPGVALPMIDDLATSGELDDYHLLHSARADLLRRMNRMDEAAKSYARALELTTNDSERRYLQRRLNAVQVNAN